MASRPTVALIGTGNVAWHFARRLRSRAEVVQVYGRDEKKCRELALQANARPIFDLSNLRTDLDYYIIMVTDNQISEVSAAMPSSIEGLVVHTAGSVGMNAICQRHKGVVYPLQTFTKGVEVDWNTVRMFTTADNHEDWAGADAVSLLLSPAPAQHITDSERLRIHVAAVWACNFLNFTLVQADDILRPSGLGVKDLKPLIEATLEKAFTIGPKDGQTGPARRGDLTTIRRHENEQTSFQSVLYTTLTMAIMSYYGETKTQGTNEEGQ